MIQLQPTTEISHHVYRPRHQSVNFSMRELAALRGPPQKGACLRFSLSLL